MIDRRALCLAAPALALLPRIARAQGTDPVAALEDAARGLDQLHSIQVQRGDEVLLAIAPRGGGLDRHANIKSCSKSLVALLLGQAIAAGDVPGVEATLGEVAPALLPPTAAEGAADITLEDLVTLRAGLERTSGGNYGGWIASRNWISDALSRPMVAEPGGQFLYSTGTTHILGAALAVATGDSLLEQARARLGDPLGMSIPPWTRDPQGYFLGGNEMALRPRDMLKVALLLRDRGRYEGTQVVPEDWMERSLTPRARSPFSGAAYGYGWFLSPTGWSYARGYGGQIIAAHAETGLAAAITSDPLRPARSEGYFGDLLRLMDDRILPLGRA